MSAGYYCSGCGATVGGNVPNTTDAATRGHKADCPSLPRGELAAAVRVDEFAAEIERIDARFVKIEEILAECLTQIRGLHGGRERAHDRIAALEAAAEQRLAALEAHR